MGKLIDLTGLGEFKTKLLNLIKPQLDASVSTVNSKSATNHAVVINADDIKMSSSENVTIPNKLKQYVKSVNGSTPDPITGDVVVAGGGGDTSVGLIRRSIGIATTAWQGSGPFTYTYSDPDIAVGMCVLEAYLSDEYAQLGINSYTIQNGSLIISTTVKPTADWNLTIALGMDGSTFMEDVSDLKTKVGNGTIDTTATTLIGAVNELNARKGSGITVSDTDSRSIATAITEQSRQIDGLQAAAAYVEDGDKASQTYTEGTFILWKGSLYTVKTGGMPQGETISTTYLEHVTGGGFNALSSSIANLTSQLTTVEYAHFDNLSDFDMYQGKIINSITIGGEAKGNLTFSANACAIIIGNSNFMHVLCIRANGELYQRNKNSGTWDSQWTNRW